MIRRLDEAGVQVRAPDLPSHRSSSLGLLADAEEVRRAIRASRPPVVVAGWSSGGAVISMAAENEQSVVRLVYVSCVPRPAAEGSDAGWLDDEPHVAVHDGMHVLDNDWWLNEEAGTTFATDVVEHLRRFPRRPASVASETEPQTAAAWQTIPTTIVVGGSDELLSDADRLWAHEHFADVRVLDCDHFILFRDPEAVSEVLVDGLVAAGNREGPVGT